MMLEEMQDNHDAMVREQQAALVERAKEIGLEAAMKEHARKVGHKGKLPNNTPSRSEEPVRLRRERAIQIIKEAGSITRNDLRAKLPFLSVADIAWLKKHGHAHSTIKSVGAREGVIATYYAGPKPEAAE
jgi:hypothetical protein